MADWGVGSSLRRLCASTGALVALGLVLAVSAAAAAPSPDPPPAPPAPPKTEPVQPTVTVVVRQAPVVTPAPVVQRPTPVRKAPAQRAKPKPAPAKVTPVVKPKAKAPAPVARPPHDRYRVPLAAFVASPSADSVDRDLLALAGFGLLLVALGGAVVLFAARRQLGTRIVWRSSASLVLCSQVPRRLRLRMHPSRSRFAQAPPAANGWYTSDVTISWQYRKPGFTAIGCDLLHNCHDTEGSDRVQRLYGQRSRRHNVEQLATVKIDKTRAVSVSGATLARAPDSERLVQPAGRGRFRAARTPSRASRLAAARRTPVATAPRPSLSGTCTDVAGNSSAAASIGFKYDATPPAVTASPDRKPDGKGWYRKPLTVSFAGTDATSGIAACTAPTRYAGPDLAEGGRRRRVPRRRRERGRGWARPSSTTRPRRSFPMAKAEVEKGVAKIVWKRSPDAVLVELERTPGMNGRKKTIVYRGNGASFTDRTVRDGIRYRYEIRASDVAGNMVQKAVTANVDLPALYRPAAGAVVRAPLVLSWEAVKGATFYNVQLYRNKVKVLTFWPKTPTFRVGKTWRYAGKLQRLGPGKYDWYVWGAKGTRAKPQYGKLLGSNSFVVK